jgi:D-beta-D-heptose 7-phosphate kinase/D-beta-D-heptose 1-phosphate adenosyltransferase
MQAERALAMGSHHMRHKPIVFTNGIFDLFHGGHRYLLSTLYKKASLLVVAVNSDASTRRLKGNSRPVDACLIRIENVTNYLNSLQLPGGFSVLEFDQDTPETLIRQIKPDVIAKGHDTPRPLAGEESVVDRGGQVWIIERLAGISTTNIIRGVFKSAGTH